MHFLITGHTGFKGSWLSLWLSSLGAEVKGYALNPPTLPSLFIEAKIDSIIDSYTNPLIFKQDIHGKFLKDDKGNRINGIAFRMADKLSLLKEGKIDVSYVLDENHWNGRKTLEINVKDIRRSQIEK